MKVHKTMLSSRISSAFLGLYLGYAGLVHKIGKRGGEYVY
jgi:hypothetical protein